MPLTRNAFLKLGAASAVAFAFRGSAALAATVELSGSVTYRQRIALPDTARLEVELVEFSASDAKETIASAAVEPTGQVPVGFTLPFDAARIDGERRYAIEARISVDDTIMFATRTPHAVDPLAPDGPVEIVLAMSDGEPPAEPAILDITWLATEIGGVPVVEGTSVTLIIGSDGRAGGNSGCNSYFAVANIEDGALSFSGLGSTYKACGEDIMAQERSLFDALATTTGYRIDGGSLILINQQSTETARFFVQS